jgi:hypothetical protein
MSKTQRRKGSPFIPERHFESGQQYLRYRLQTAVDVAHVATTRASWAEEERQVSEQGRPLTEQERGALARQRGVAAHEQAMARFRVETGVDPGKMGLEPRIQRKMAASLGYDPSQPLARYLEEPIFGPQQRGGGHQYLGTKREAGSPPPGASMPDIVAYEGQVPQRGSFIEPLQTQRGKELSPFRMTRLIDLKFQTGSSPLSWGEPKGDGQLSQFERYSRIAQQHGASVQGPAGERKSLEPELMGPTSLVGDVGRFKNPYIDYIESAAAHGDPREWSPQTKALHRRTAAVMHPERRDVFAELKAQPYRQAAFVARTDLRPRPSPINPHVHVSRLPFPTQKQNIQTVITVAQSLDSRRLKKS